MKFNKIHHVILDLILSNKLIKKYDLTKKGNLISNIHLDNS